MAPAFPKTFDLLQPVLSRRSAIRLGVGGLAGGSFFNLLGMSQAARAAGGKKPSSCILIWMDGGPTHFETFDPKPDAPVEIRGEFRPISDQCAWHSDLRALAERWPQWLISTRSYARSVTIRATMVRAITT